jgi:hypothetical protein
MYPNRVTSTVTGMDATLSGLMRNDDADVPG